MTTNRRSFIKQAAGAAAGIALAPAAFANLSAKTMFFDISLAE